MFKRTSYAYRIYSCDVCAHALFFKINFIFIFLRNGESFFVVCIFVGILVCCHLNHSNIPLSVILFPVSSKNILLVLTVAHLCSSFNMHTIQIPIKIEENSSTQSYERKMFESIVYSNEKRFFVI